MSIFDRTSLMESVNSLDIDVAPYTGEIEPTMESVAEMSAELNEGVYKLNTSLYVADLLLEQRAEAGEDVEPLIEAAIGDFFNNMIEKFKKMWSKIKAFFASIFKKIEIFVSTGKHFIAKYEKGILAASKSNNVKWITFNEKESPEDILNFVKGVPKAIDPITKLVSGNPGVKDLKAEAKKIEKTFASSLASGAETYAEAKDEATKQIKGKKTGVSETLSASIVNAMLKRVKEYLGKGKTEVQNQAKKMDTLCANCITKIKNFETKAKKDASESKMGDISNYCTEMSKAVSFAQWVCSKSTAAYTRQYHNDLNVLKAFASKNSKLITRESAEYFDGDSASDSLLESIIDAF